MKTLGTLLLSSIIVATLALGQTQNISLVKGTPTNYGAYDFEFGSSQPAHVCDC